MVDLSRSKADLIAENALLRHQLALLKRQAKRPRLSPADRLNLLVLAKLTKTWRQALLIVQTATLLRWHRGLSPVLEVEEPQARLSAAHLGRDDCPDSPDVR